MNATLEEVSSQLHATLGRLEIALGAIDEAIVWTDMKGTIQWCNGAFDRFAECRHIELLGSPLSRFLPPSAAESSISRLLAPDCLSRTQFAHLGEIENHRDNGLQRVEISGQTVVVGEEQDVAIYVFRDVTERRNAEDQQKKLLAELKRTNQELEDFAYAVSHDLKAPLRGIAALATWVIEDSRDKLDASGKDNLDRLQRRVKTMQALIDGILQYSRIGRVREQVRLVDIADVLREVIEVLSPPENITIDIAGPLPVVSVEKVRIQQVVQNLLSNAIKFNNKPQGRIVVTAGDDGDFWRLSVSDNGPGIEERYFEKIFKLFQTLQANEKGESTGIGLSLVQRIVETHGGKVWLESKLGEGTTFFFTLPKLQAS